MLKFKNTVAVNYQCTVYCIYRVGQKFGIIAILVYFVIIFFGLSNKNFWNFLNRIYFRTREGRQKPEKHCVTKSDKLIVDSPFR